MRGPNTLILPILNPVTFFRNQTMQFTAFADWQKAVRIQQEGPTRVHPPIETWQWQPTFATVKDYLGNAAHHRDCRCGSEWDGPWSIDFEATVNRDIVCLGLWSCAKPFTHRGLCIPFLSQGGVPYWNPSDEKRLLELVRAFFIDPLQGKIGQNTVGYDTGYPPFHTHSLLYTAWGITIAGLVGDTMVAHHTCFSELRHGLSFLSSMSTDLSPYKEELWEQVADEEDDGADEWTRILERPDEKVRKYNLKDAFAQAVVWNELEREMQ